MVEKHSVDYEFEIDDYLRAASEKPDRSKAMSDAYIYVNEYVKDEHLRNYALKKIEEMRKSAVP
jgi:hypothetical protein